jgi:hypothetical protein
MARCARPSSATAALNPLCVRVYCTHTQASGESFSTLVHSGKLTIEGQAGGGLAINVSVLLPFAMACAHQAHT